MCGCSASGAGHGGNVASGAGSLTLMVLDLFVTFASTWMNLHGDPTIANVGSNTCLSGKCCRPVYGSPKTHESWRYVLLRIRHSRTSGCVAGASGEIAALRADAVEGRRQYDRPGAVFEIDFFMTWSTRKEYQSTYRQHSAALKYFRNELNSGSVAAGPTAAVAAGGASEAMELPPYGMQVATIVHPKAVDLFRR